MTICQEVLDKLLKVDRAHAKAIAKADELKLERLALVLELTDKGATRAELADALGLTRARVQQLVDAARTPQA